MDSPVKRDLVLVPGSFGVGGVERVVSFLASAWSERHEVAVLPFEDPSFRLFFPMDRRVQLTPLGRSGGPIHAWSPRAYVDAFRQMRRLRSAFKDRVASPRGPVVLVSFMGYYNVLSLLACAGCGVRRVVSNRNQPVSNSWLLRGLQALLYPWADCIVVQTPAARERLPRWLRRKAVVIPNPVTRPTMARGSLEKTPHDRPFLLGVGRLAHQKRFDLLIEAFAALAAEFPEWDLRIAGEGALRPSLERQARSRGVAARVIFEGNVEPSRLFVRSDVFVLSSDYEGFPNALCEAMAAGSAVVARDYGPELHAIVRHGVDGYIVAKSDAAALARSLRPVLSDSVLRSRLGEAATAVADRFSAGEVLSAWEAALGGRAATGAA